MKGFKITLVTLGLALATIINGTAIAAEVPPPPKKGERAANAAEAREQFLAMKVAFFSNDLNLTPQEAELFWPLYNEFWEKRVKSRKEFMQIMEKVNSPEPKGKEQIERLSEQFLLNLSKESDLMREYYIKFKKVLPTEKALKIFNTEEKFKKSLLNRYKRGKGGEPKN